MHANGRVPKIIRNQSLGYLCLIVTYRTLSLNKLKVVNQTYNTKFQVREETVERFPALPSLLTFLLKSAV